MISFLLVTRNDNYAGNSIDRLKISLNYNIQNLKKYFPNNYNDYEFLIGDWGSDDDIKINDVLIEEFENIRIVKFPKEVTNLFDTDFNEVHSLNFLIKNSKCDYVARLDQDIIVGSDFFKYVLNNGLKNDKFYWSTRRDLHSGVISEDYNSPSWKISGDNFEKGAIGIILSLKDNFIKIKGYNEKLIYRNHMEHDLYSRFLNLLGDNSCINLGVELNVPFFHIYHERLHLSKRKNNDLNDLEFNNDEFWGLENYKNIIKII